MKGGMTGLQGRLNVRRFGRGGKRKGWLWFLREWERKLREFSWDGVNKFDSDMTSGSSEKTVYEKKTIEMLI